MNANILVWGECFMPLISPQTFYNFEEDILALTASSPLLNLYPGAKAVVGYLLWGSSPSLDYVLDDVKCFGYEGQLLDCQSSSVLSHNCLHTEEAGVTCHGERLRRPVTKLAYIQLVDTLEQI